MGLPRSTYYDAPTRKADDGEIVTSVARQRLSDKMAGLRKKEFLAHRSPLGVDDETSKRARG